MKTVERWNSNDSNNSFKKNLNSKHFKTSIPKPEPYPLKHSNLGKGSSPFPNKKKTPSIKNKLTQKQPRSKEWILKRKNEILEKLNKQKKEQIKAKLSSKSSSKIVKNSIKKDLSNLS